MTPPPPDQSRRRVFHTSIYMISLSHLRAFECLQSSGSGEVTVLNKASPKFPPAPSLSSIGFYPPSPKVGKNEIYGRKIFLVQQRWDNTVGANAPKPPPKQAHRAQPAPPPPRPPAPPPKAWVCMC